MVTTRALKDTFSEVSKESFSFLENEGFGLVSDSPTHLRYESDKVSITVERCPRSGELNVFLGLRDDESGDALSLSDLLLMENIDVLEAKNPLQVYDQENLKPALMRLAHDLRCYAGAALVGDRMYFHRLKAFRNAKASAYLRNMELKRIRAEAAQAWRRRDLQKLIELFLPIENYLAESERAKLAYARKHQNNTSSSKRGGGGRGAGQ